MSLDFSDANGGTGSVPPKAKKEFLGHPIGLFVLFFTEMWERFSYYGMRALLVLYMVEVFKWTQEDASRIYKWYTALVYLTPLLGGFLADRYLGNTAAIVIGAIMMAIGHLVMAIEVPTFMYIALVFLIFGNGFFKPNMSTQVGRLYPDGDTRKDSAYTIFYMGINLGAFLAPILCALIKDNTSLGFSGGFGLAGVGMLLALGTYLLGKPYVVEISGKTDGSEKKAEKKAEKNEGALSEEQVEKLPSALPLINYISPELFLGLGLLGPVIALIGVFLLHQKPDNMAVFGIGGVVSALIGYYVSSGTKNGLRDRVLAIFVIGAFVIFFWGAFEQAGNSMTIFANDTTNRYVTTNSPDPELFPSVSASQFAPTGAVAKSEVASSAGSLAFLNPMSTEFFQSINPFAIFILAPLFSWLWIWLPSKGYHLSISFKVATGIFIQGLAFALMIWAIQYENQPTSASLNALPANFSVIADNKIRFVDAPDLGEDVDGHYASKDHKLAIIQGDRLTFDTAAKTFGSKGVMSEPDRDRMLRATAPVAYIKNLNELAKASGEKLPAIVTLTEVPAGFDLRYSGLKKEELTFDAEKKTLTTTVKLEDKHFKALLVCGSDENFRKTINEVFVASSKFKVGIWWLFWFYILSTIGELCLSPVGLSMVSKLAPAKYSTMLMGVWLLTSFFGNFLAGMAGEEMGAIHPASYFAFVAAILMGTAILAYILTSTITRMMQGVE